VRRLLRTLGGGLLASAACGRTSRRESRLGGLCQVIEGAQSCFEGGENWTSVAAEMLSHDGGCPQPVQLPTGGPLGGSRPSRRGVSISLRRRLIRHSDVLLALWRGGTRDCGRLPTGPAVEGTLKVSPNTESFIKLLNPYGQPRPAHNRCSEPVRRREGQAAPQAAQIVQCQRVRAFSSDATRTI